MRHRYPPVVRTTVNIRDEALEACRKAAEAKGVSLGEVISEAILDSLGERPGGGRRRRYDLPVSGEGGLRPGVDLDSSAALEDLMEGRG
jgi:hypothetical protein